MSASSRARLARIVTAERVRVLDRYNQELRGTTSGVAAYPAIHQVFLDDAAEVLTAMVDALERGGPLDRLYSANSAPKAVEASPLLAKLHANELLLAEVTLLRVIHASIGDAVRSEPDASELATIASLLVSQCVMASLRTSLTAIARIKLGEIHEGYLDERRQIARDLHDRIGHNINAARQNIDLAEMYTDREPGQVRAKLAIAKESLDSSLSAVRKVIFDLRQRIEPNTLQQVLANYVEVMAPSDVAVDLAVNGEETWLPPLCLDELFLILRESLSNAFKHARAGGILVRVDIVPHLVRAVVKDDGVGFDVTEAMTGHDGLASIHERAELLGGSASISSTPGVGTSVEVIIPLAREAG